MATNVVAFAGPVAVPRSAQFRLLLSSSSIMMQATRRSGKIASVAVSPTSPRSDSTRRAHMKPRRMSNKVSPNTPPGSPLASSQSTREKSPKTSHHPSVPIVTNYHSTSTPHPASYQNRAPASNRSGPRSKSGSMRSARYSKLQTPDNVSTQLNEEIAPKINDKRSTAIDSDSQEDIKTPPSLSTTGTQVSSTTVPSVTPEEAKYLNQCIAERRAEKEAAEAATLKKKRSPRKRSRQPRASPTNIADTFRAYMVDISRDDLLDTAQVSSLARDIRAGVAVERIQHQLQSSLGQRPTLPQVAKKLGIDVKETQRRMMVGTAAKNALVSANLRLVTSVATKLAKSKSNATPGITLDDMVQEGSVGLIRAAEKYDASRGYRFSTYATWWVRAYIMRSITTQGRSIKIPSSVVDEYARIRKVYAAFREQGNPNPTEDQVAANLGITIAKMRFVVNVVTQVPASLDMPVDVGPVSGNVRLLGDIIPGDDDVEEKLVSEMERKELDVAMKKYLRPIERAVVRLRFGLEDGQPRSFRETGELVGLSKERIRQIVYAALPKLRNAEIQQMLLDATTR